MTETNDKTLLDAVEALTRPFVLARFTGIDHDHEWLDLVRPFTREERDVAKKDKRKLRGMAKTGEWWCPWCDTVVTERPQDHGEQRINRQDEPPLLEQLEARIRTTLGDAGTRGANTGGSPIDVAAFTRANGIARDVSRWIEQLGGRVGRNLTLTQLLQSWHTLRLGGVNPVGEDDRYRDTLEGWRTAILDILDPPEQIPYRGQACPICGETRAIKEIEGNVEDSVALWALLRPAYREEGSYGLCRACDTVLARDADPLTLRRKMNGTLGTGRMGFVHQSATDTPDATAS